MVTSLSFGFMSAWRCLLNLLFGYSGTIGTVVNRMAKPVYYFAPKSGNCDVQSVYRFAEPF